MKATKIKLSCSSQMALITHSSSTLPIHITRTPHKCSINTKEACPNNNRDLVILNLLTLEQKLKALRKISIQAGSVECRVLQTRMPLLRATTGPAILSPTLRALH